MITTICLALFFLDAVVQNPNETKSLVNNVQFHPQKHLLAATYTQNHQVLIFDYEENPPSLFQALDSPGAPQHVLFLSDGQRLLTSNWLSDRFTFYSENEKGQYQEICSQEIPQLENKLKPHGMSATKDGKFLVVALGADKTCGKAIALFEIIGDTLQLLDWISSKELGGGIPKGISFTPDEHSFLVTFSVSNTLSQYHVDWKNKKLAHIPFITKTGIIRGEDIAFHPSGDYFAVSQSTQHCVTFHRYNYGMIVDEPPFQILKGFQIPHGLAFSKEGDMFAVTQFGTITFNSDEAIIDWGNPRRDWVFLYNCSPNLALEGHTKTFGSYPNIFSD